MLETVRSLCHCDQHTAVVFGLLIFGLVFLNRTVVIHERKCAFVVGVGVALGAFVVRAEIA